MNIAALLAFVAMINYIPWGVDEYEFFGLTKPQLAEKFKNKLVFENDYQKAIFKTFKGCHSYDGASFSLSFENGKVSKVQRIFLGCNETLQGEVFESKDAALRYAINELGKYEKRGSLRPDEAKKLQAARAEMKATSK